LADRQRKAQVQPPVAGVSVYFRVFDVPDPSVPNSPANDNNGTPNYGTLSAGAATTANGHAATAGAGNAQNSFKLIGGVVQP